MSLKYTLHFDGACWPNPDGRASYGYTIVHEGKQVADGHGLAGDGKGMSNNFAEFYALYKGLEGFVNLQADYKSTLNVLGDSQLVVKMLNKKTPKAKKDRLYYPAYIKTWFLLFAVKERYVVNLQWVPRAQNQGADDLSKIDQIEVCPYENKA